MRRSDRITAPSCLTDKAPGWTRNYLQRLEENPTAAFHWGNRDCYREIRQRLNTMTQTHCAFCDGILGPTSRKTVEHFFPKESTKWPALAYVWTNLFPACDTCQSAKNNRFDGLLLKPDEPHYRFERFFLIDYMTGVLQPLPSALPHLQERAQKTIDLYGLNEHGRPQARLRELKHFQNDPDQIVDEFNYRFLLEP